MQIIASRPKDADTLTAIAVAAKRHWHYPEHWIQNWAQLLTITPDYIRIHPTFAAVENDETLGFYALGVTAAEASLDHLWVRPSAMGRGVGRFLFTHCERTGREAGAARLKIESDPNAEGFYHRMGATTISRVPAPIDGQERYLPVLVKSLAEPIPIDHSWRSPPSSMKIIAIVAAFPN